MGKHRRAFSREPADQRRHDLIQATLDLIGESGFASATVREIAQRAGVTQGLIRHYFDTKEELIAAAFEHHMTQLTEDALFPVGLEGLTAGERLAAVVSANLTAPVLEENTVILWASFLGKIRSVPEIHETHKRTYLQFRQGFEELIHAAYIEAGRIVRPDDCRRLAIACNAVIDGLWMEGGASPSTFDEGELERIGLTSIGAILNLNLVKNGVTA